mmetsp:Transcript_6489/g.10093  ORF Transcript_6489/g.10093 Transcript_6489/m.10093 type:complete len:86 (+) Transcript_6489:560-817(+)
MSLMEEPIAVRASSSSAICLAPQQQQQSTQSTVPHKKKKPSGSNLVSSTTFCQEVLRCVYACRLVQHPPSSLQATRLPATYPQGS